MSFKMAEVRDERELEDLIVRDPEQIEKGLKVLGRQSRTDRGPLDILGVDADGVLVVIELKTGQDEGQLVQALAYYDWVYENRPALAQFYPDVGISIRIPPRIMLVARDFSESLKTIAKYVNAKLSLKAYRCVEDGAGNRGVVCTDIAIPRPKEPPLEPPRLEDHINYIQDQTLRDLLVSTIEKIRNMGENIEVYPTYAYIVIRADYAFAWIYARMTYFNILIAGPPSTLTYQIARPEDLSEEMWEKLKDAFLKYGGRLRGEGQ